MFWSFLLWGEWVLFWLPKNNQANRHEIRKNEKKYNWKTTLPILHSWRWYKIQDFLKKLVSLIYDSKVGRIFHFLAYYPYMIITLGLKRTLQITWKLKRTFYIFLQALCYWDFSSSTCGVGREFGKGAQKCRGGWINSEKLQELVDELDLSVVKIYG